MVSRMFGSARSSRVIFVLAKLARFWQDLQKPRFESGRERFSRQLLSLFQTGSSRINQSGGKACLMKTKTSLKTHSMNRSFRHCGRVMGLFSALALIWVALLPAVRAVDPPPDGGYPNGNTAEGTDALFSVTTGFDNAALGFNALYSVTTGSANTADGVFALGNNTDASQNTATGFEALIFNTTGASNTSVGYNSLLNNTTGSNNIALGASAGMNLTTGNFNIDIGNPGVASESRAIRIGTTGTHARTFIAGISGATVPDGVGVIVGANGKLGTVVSSARFKHEIKPMDKASEAILALKPVTFRYNREVDPEGIPQFGLVAEEVEKVNPDLVARDEQGKPFTVRYEAVNAMLLNEFLKEHQTVQELRK